MKRLVLPLLLVACASDRTWPGGTGVGNPGTTKLALARAEGLDVRSASGDLAALEVERCGGEVRPTAVDEAVDLLATEPYRVDGGQWCALVARFVPPLLAEGDDGEDDPATFAFELDVAEVRVEVDGRLVVDRDALILELGHPAWIEDALGELADGSSTDVRPGDPGHDALAAGLAEGSALFRDADRDGSLDAGERAAGPVARGPAWVEDDD